MKRNSMQKQNLILIVLGTFFIVLGSIGIFIPLLPTTPFLLLAAACYAKGSNEFYRKLIQSRVLGEYIRNYREGGGVPLSSKIYALSLLWISIGSSIILIAERLIIRVVLLLIAAAVSIHIISIKTAAAKANKKNNGEYSLPSNIKDGYSED